MGTTTTAPKLAPGDIQKVLKREGLIGMTAAARLLGIRPPNFKRDAAPHLTELTVEGSASVYLRSEVQKLARQLTRKRAARNGH